MRPMQRIRMGLLLANIKLGRLTRDAYSGPKDPNPENWRTISGAKVHLTNGKIDGGAGGKFHGNNWNGKEPHKDDKRDAQGDLFGNFTPILSKQDRQEQKNRERRKKYNEKYGQRQRENMRKAEERKRAEENREWEQKKRDLSTLDPWKMSKEELAQERKRLEEEVNSEYWRFSHSPSAKRGYSASSAERLAQVRAASGEKIYPWQWNKEMAKRKGITEANHKKRIEKALEEGKPVPDDVLKDYPDLEEKYFVPF